MKYHKNILNKNLLII